MMCARPTSHAWRPGRTSSLRFPGQFERAQALDLLGPVLLSWRRRGLLRSRCRNFAGPEKAAKFSEKLDRQQTVVFDAYPDAGVTAKDYLTGEMVDELLSGMSSRLFVRVREELGLGVFCRCVPRHRPAHGDDVPLRGHAASDASGKVLAEFDAEAARLRDRGIIEDAELARAAGALEGELADGLRQSPSQPLAATGGAFKRPL